MSGPHPSTAGDEREREAVAYLREHPDLLSRHPEILETLEVPHACGRAVSLVEYQVNVLRERNLALRRRLEQLVAHARENEELGRRLHRLTLGLVASESLGDVLERLHQGLAEDFRADLAAVRLLAAPRAPADAGLGEFAPDPEAGASLFASVLAERRPICGRLRREQAEFLFGERAPDVGSAALVPLLGSAPLGVLAVASRDAERYHPGMGTMFLRQLGEVVSECVARHVTVP